MQGAIRLRELIAEEKLLIVPGAYDCITASLIQKAGFSAVYVTGAGVSLSLLGQPDLNTVSYLEFKERVDSICSMVNIPVIADIDTGFGGPLNMIRLVKDFERMGVAGVQIEDQGMPKRCGHTSGCKVVTCEEMCRRIQAIYENRSGINGIVIIARTDSRSEFGLDEAIQRGNCYLESGADVVFIESPRSLEEVMRIGREVKGPVLFNNVEGGRSPFVDRYTLESSGFRIAIYPNSIARIMIASGIKLLKTLKETGSTEECWKEMLTHKEMYNLFEHDQWLELEKKYML